MTIEKSRTNTVRPARVRGAARGQGEGRGRLAADELDSNVAPRWWESPAGGLVLKLIPGVAFLAIWQGYAMIARSTMIPPASDTIVSLLDIITRPEVWDAFARSNVMLLIGYLISVVIGVPLGFLMGRVKVVERLADPWLDLLVIVPMAAVIPLVIMSLGLGLPGQVFVVVAFTLSMIAVNCRAGVREVPEVLIDMARVYGARSWQIWMRVLLPGASPAVFAGLRIGLGRAILGMVLVEMIMTAVGVGTLLQQYRGRFEYADLDAVIILIIAESLALIGLLGLAESRLVPWADRRSRATG